MDTHALRFYHLMKEIVTCCQGREAYQAKTYGLTVAEARCLVVIRQEHCRTTADLAEKLDVAKSRITRIVDGLVRKGLAVRSEDANDRRITLIKLSRKGMDISEKFISFMLALHNELLNEIPGNFKGETLTVLTALNEAMQSVKVRLEEGEFRSESA